MKQYFQQQKIDVKGFIKFVAELGHFSAVELGYYWKNEEKELYMVNKWLNEYNLKLSGYIVGNDFAWFEDNRRREQINKVKHAIDCAYKLGTNIVRVFVGDIKEKINDYDDVKRLLIYTFLEICDYAKNKNVILAVENHGKLCAKYKQLLDLFLCIRAENMRFNIDIGNFLLVGESPVEAIPKLIDKCVLVHLKDYKKIGNEFVPCIIGEGDVNLKECLKIFKEYRYNGYFSLEYEAEEDAVIGIKKSLDNILKLI
jgi:sugar phosphate isomerase/epimerase